MHVKNGKCALSGKTAYFQPRKQPRIFNLGAARFLFFSNSKRNGVIAFMINVKDVQLGTTTRKSFAKINEVMPMPNLIEVQKQSYQWFLDCDLIVLSMGVRPDNALYNELKVKYKNVYAIGDCDKTGRIYNATESAYQLAKSI